MDVFGIVIDDFSDIGLTGVQTVVVAGVIDNPDIRDDEVFNASATISIDHVICDQGSGSIGAGGRIGAVAEVHDDAVAVAMIG